jgi:hypothetical protein
MLEKTESQDLRVKIKIQFFVVLRVTVPPWRIVRCCA